MTNYGNAMPEYYYIKQLNSFGTMEVILLFFILTKLKRRVKKKLDQSQIVENWLKLNGEKIRLWVLQDENDQEHNGKINPTQMSSN